MHVRQDIKPTLLFVGYSISAPALRDGLCGKPLIHADGFVMSARGAASLITMRWLLLTFLSASLSFAQDVTPPTDATPMLSVEGRGVQIYVCTRQSEKLVWVFQAPEAELFTTANASTGTHGAGPIWTWNDGSSVRGTVVRKQPSPDHGSIPWLLLSASPASEVRGMLTPATWIRRSATKGGDAPSTGCDATHEQAVARVPYAATYTFYTTRK